MITFQKWRSVIETYFKTKKFTWKFDKYEPVSYRTQVVKGIKYTIVIRVSTTKTISVQVVDFAGKQEVLNIEEKPATFTGLETTPVKIPTVVCPTRFVDCSKRNGYDPADKCKQTCMDNKTAVVCPMRFVDCSKRGGYDPADQCKQTCADQNATIKKPEPVMCIKRYVDCSRRGGYDPKDKCRQTCVNKKEDKTKPKIPVELERPDAVKLPQAEVKKMEGEVAAFFKMGAVGLKAW
jgi:hypothetical protein